MSNINIKKIIVSACPRFAYPMSIEKFINILQTIKIRQVQKYKNTE